jgi:hypothetical protein
MPTYRSAPLERLRGHEGDPRTKDGSASGANACALVPLLVHGIQISLGSVRSCIVIFFMFNKGLLELQTEQKAPMSLRT